MTPFRWLCALAVLALGASLFTLGPSASTAATADLAEQQQKQRQIQTEAENLVRRIETVIRVLEYNRLEKSTEKQLLDEVSKDLTGLTRQQMSALIVVLEKAGKSKGNLRDTHL